MVYDEVWIGSRGRVGGGEGRGEEWWEEEDGGGVEGREVEEREGREGERKGFVDGEWMKC